MSNGNSEIGTVAYLDIHGLKIQCRSQSSDLTLDLVRPFKYFIREEDGSTIQVVVKEEPPPYDQFPPLRAKFFTPRNVVYQDGSRKIIDYFGKGVVLEENNGTSYQIYGFERNFLSEVFYLLVLSLLGQFCDQNGLLRVHALALSYRNKAILVLLPQGGGKSTMAFNMLREPEFGYISDDDPIVDRFGRVLPFPRPLGGLDRSTFNGIPDRYIYSIDRMEFGIKHYIDYDYWANRVEKRHLDDIILFIGRRILNGDPSIRQTSELRALSTLMRDAVVGVGLYQGLEFLFNNSSWDALRKIPALVKRFLRALKLSHIADSYEFTISGNAEKNSRILKEFLNRLHDKDS